MTDTPHEERASSTTHHPKDDPTRVILQPDLKNRGRRWHVLCGEDILRLSSPRPEHHAALALVVLGHSGWMVTRHMDSPHDALRMGIERAARSPVTETDLGGFKTEHLSDEKYAAALARARALLDGDDAAAAEDSDD